MFTLDFHDTELTTPAKPEKAISQKAILKQKQKALLRKKPQTRYLQASAAYQPWAHPST